MSDIGRVARQIKRQTLTRPPVLKVGSYGNGFLSRIKPRSGSI